MMPTLIPLTPHLGYEVRGVDASRPLPPAVQELLRGAMATRGLLLLRDQQLTDEQQVAFARVFGRISKQGPVQRVSPDATYVSNVRPDGTFGDGELAFHSDQAYFEFPMKAIMLYGIEIPGDGGETLFSSSAAVAERLPAQLRERLAGRQVLNRLDYGALQLGASVRKDVASLVIEARHSALTIHEPSQLPIHMVIPDTTAAIDGYDDAQARAIIDQVHEIVASDDLVYRHRWRVGDLLVWDNILLQHARSPFDSTARRTLRRCAIANDREPIEAAAEGAQR